MRSKKLKSLKLKPQNKRKLGKSLGLRKIFKDKRAVILIVALAIIGTITLYRGYAATQYSNNTVEGENLNWSKGIKRKYSNYTYEEALYWGATGTGTVQTPGDISELSVIARGDQCNGAPKMIVKLDNKQIISTDVSSNKYTSIKANVDPKLFKAGKHLISISFPNDYAAFIRNKWCDRNLYIDKVVVTSKKEIADQKPTTPPKSNYNPKASFNIIMIGWRAEQEKDYSKLANTNTNLIYRTCIDYGKNSKSIQRWEAANQKYLYTIAASDKSVTGSIYVNQKDAEEVVKRSNNLGFYMHEIVAYNAAISKDHPWDWNVAASRINWAFVDSLVMNAKAQGKKVVWSEPAQGWQALNNGKYDAYFKKWGNTFVPMFATNFETDSFHHMSTARAAALSVSQKFNTPLGESTQSWYFREQPKRYPNGPSVTDSYNLSKYGLDVGSSYYQIEGTYPDMAWGTNYMQGIYKFSQTLSTTSPKKPPVVQTPPRVALYQFWNNSSRDHFYTTNEGEFGVAQSLGYQYQEVAGYIYSAPTNGAAPLYRLWSSNSTDHFYTTDVNQKNGATSSFRAYVDEGIIGYMPTTAVAGSRAFHQLWTTTLDPDHYYTADQNAMQNAINNWPYYQYQGVVGYIFSTR